MVEQQIKENKTSFIRKILKSQVFYCLLVVLFWLLYLIIDFLGGYHGFHLIVGLLPAIIVPFLFAFIFSLIVLIRAI